MTRHDTRGQPRLDPHSELDTLSYHVLENSLGACLLEKGEILTRWEKWKNDGVNRVGGR